MRARAATLARRTPVAAAMVLGACGGTVRLPATTPAATSTADDEAAARIATSKLARDEVDVLAWLSAADPRLAARTGVVAPAEVLERVGMGAVLAEDAVGGVRGGSVDLFAFEARRRALSQAAERLGTSSAALPVMGAVGAELRRPRLERELLRRLVDEERVRAEEESRLGDASGELVRAMVATWTPPATPQEVPDRDAWAARHLLEIRDSLRPGGPRTEPPSVDEALYPLERLLAPLQYPRGAAAIAQLRVALDQDTRPVPRIESADRLTREVRVHLGLTVVTSALPARLLALAGRLREAVAPQLAALDDVGRAATLAHAQSLLLVEGNCPAVPDSPVRSMAAPPERVAVCGALRALSDPTTVLPAMVALHDDALLAVSAVTEATPPRSRLLSNPAGEDVDALQRTARERPVVALAPALAADVVFPGAVDPGRLAAWKDLGEVPLDVLARELGPT